MEHIDLYVYAADLATERKSLYRNNRNGRTDLINFISANNGFGYRYEANSSALKVEKDAMPAVHDKLELWLQAYRQPCNVKIGLMLDVYAGKYPKTCELYRGFILGKDVNTNKAYWQLLDYMLAEIDREITDYSELEMDSFAIRLGLELTLGASQLFSEFAKTAIHKPSQIYSFAPREQPALINEAYAVKDFAVMAYCVFNEEVWASQDMLVKAVRTKALADLWLFVALHLICALRCGDMERLPAPTLPHGGEMIHQMILAGTFSKHEAAAVTDELLVRLKLKPIKPSKTKQHSGVPDLKLFVPESLREPLGIIIALAAAHQTELKAGSSFVKPCDSLYNLRLLFGERFVEAAGYRRFSSRRGNKSYLQGIDTVASYDATISKPKGYILAALARSHKGGIGSLPEITDIYLQDANFTGYKPEFIIRELFERGVFSFIPAVLIEMYSGNSLKKLPVSAQTQLISSLGLNALQVEHIAEAVERSYSAARLTVKSLLINAIEAADLREDSFIILQNIASGAAPSKQPEYLCLMTAAHRGCQNISRGSCLGCGYEIYTKSAMHLLMKEYLRLSGRKGGSGKRGKKIIEVAIMPAVAEILSAMQRLNSYGEDPTILEIVERGLNYVDTENNRTIQQVDQDRRY